MNTSAPSTKTTFTIDDPYYTSEWGTLAELIHDVVHQGYDPNYYIVRNGVTTGELLADLVQF